jgi:lipoprotein NlpI/transglutaminase-like putative cysteine protease
MHGAQRFARLWVLVLSCLAQYALGVEVPLAGATGVSAGGAVTSNEPKASTQPGKEVQLGEEAFVRGSPVADWVEPVSIPEPRASGPLVLLLADTQFLVRDQPAVSVRRVVQINDPQALSRAGQLSIEFIPEYQRLYLHRVRVRRDGVWLDRTQTARLKFLQRETGLEEGLYSGVITAAILVEDLRVGDVLEYHYSTVGANPVFAGRFADRASWDQPMPTQVRRVSIVFPQARSIAWKFVSDIPFPSRVPVRTQNTGDVKLVFEEHDLAAVLLETNLPGDFQPFRTLQFSEFASWDDVVQWARTLFPLERAPSAGLTQVVNALRALPDQQSQVAAALEFVQTQIRYVSVSLGESSHRPAPPNEVLARRYGDCKDKTYLLMTILGELDVTSHPVLLQLGQRHGLEGVLPSPLVFNHVILEVELPGQRYYLDATRLGQHPPLASMGQIHEGAQVLLVDAVSHGPSVIPANARALAPDDELVETGSVGALGEPVQFETRQSWVGYRAEVMRSLLENLAQPQRDKVLLAGLQRRFPEARLNVPVEVEDQQDPNKLTLIARFSVPGLLQEKDGNWFAVILPPNLSGLLPYPIAADRHVPVGFTATPSHYRYTLEMNYPESVTVQSDPESRTVRGPGFSVTASSSYRGHDQRISIDFITSTDRIEPGEIAQYNTAAHDAQGLARAVAFVPKDTQRASRLAGVAGQDFKGTLKNREENVVKRITATIDAAKLSETDLARAYCDRGVAEGALGRLEEAHRDADRAVQMAPDLFEVFECRAAVHFIDGDFSKSVADYSHALSLGADPAPVLYQRGISRFYQGDFEHAADDFALASQKDDNLHVLYSDLWLIWTDQRLHRVPPQEVSQRATADPRGEWPRPALAMLLGVLAPEEMSKLMDAKGGDERDMARGEGYFYLAQHYLVVGNVTLAREYLERCRAQGILNDSEYTAAQWELRRLDVAARVAPAGSAGLSSASSAESSVLASP